MKRLVILLIALLPVSTYAQGITVDHTQKDILWEAVYNSNISYDDALDYILAYRILDDVVTHGNMIAGELSPGYIDYSSAGYSRMKVPLYLSNGRFTCRVIIRFKEGRYKVDAFNMRFIDSESQLGTITALYDGHGVSTFNIAIELVMRHLIERITIKPFNNDW